MARVRTRAVARVRDRTMTRVRDRTIARVRARARLGLGPRRKFQILMQLPQNSS